MSAVGELSRPTLTSLIAAYHEAKAAGRAAPDETADAANAVWINAFYAVVEHACRTPDEAVAKAELLVEVITDNDMTVDDDPLLLTIFRSMAGALRGSAAKRTGDADAQLRELAAQFKSDAMAIDPSITGMWTYHDQTIEGRDSAFQGLYLEREGSPLIRRQARQT